MDPDIDCVATTLCVRPFRYNLQVILKSFAGQSNAGIKPDVKLDVENGNEDCRGLHLVARLGFVDFRSNGPFGIKQRRKNLLLCTIAMTRTRIAMRSGPWLGPPMALQ